MLVRSLWDKHRDWDDPVLPQDLLQALKDWKGELQYLPQIILPRAYEPAEVDQSSIRYTYSAMRLNKLMAQWHT